MVWTGYHGTSRGECRRVTAAMDAIRSHVIVVSGSGRGATGTVAESVHARAGPSRAPRRDVAPSGSGAIRVPPGSGREESGPDGVPMRSHVAVVSSGGQGAAVTVAESVRVKPGPSPAPRRDVAPSNVGAIRVLRRGAESPVWTGWRGLTAGQARVGLRGVTVVDRRSRPAPGRATEGVAGVVKDERGRGKQCHRRIRQ